MEGLPSEQSQDITSTPATDSVEDTINEPISASLLRDVRSIIRKLSVVLIPSKKNEFEKELKNCMFLIHFVLQIYYIVCVVLDYLCCWQGNSGDLLSSVLFLPRLTHLLLLL